MAGSLDFLRPSAHLVCRMCVACICAIVIVLRPSAKLGGQYLFLILTVKEIVFPPSTSASAQIEATFINITGALVGLGWSNLGLVCASFAAEQYGSDSSTPRTIKAVFLLVIGFLGWAANTVSTVGYARSGLPRLAFASRAAGLVSIFLLADDRGTYKWTYTNFTELLFVCTVAGAASLVVALVAQLFVPPEGYAKDVICALGSLKDLVRLATTRTISPDSSSSNTLETLQRSCLDASLGLHSSYAYSTFELRIGRVPVSHIRPLVASVGRIREELAWGVVRAGVHVQDGSGPPFADEKSKEAILNEGQLSEDELRLLATLDTPCQDCADSITEGIAALQIAIGICYNIDTSDITRPKPEPTDKGSTRSGGILDSDSVDCKEREQKSLLDVQNRRTRLIQTRTTLQTQLDWVVHSMNAAHMLSRSPNQAMDTSSSSITIAPTELRTSSRHHQLFRKSLYAMSLLHISSEVRRCTNLIISVLEDHTMSPARIFFPRPSRMWLGMSPRALVIEHAGEEPNVDSSTIDSNETTCRSSEEGEGPSMQELKQGFLQWNKTLLALPVMQSTKPTPFHKKIKSWWYSLRSLSIDRHSIYRWMCAVVDFPGVVLTRQWNRSKILRFRIASSHFARRVQHSKHVRHAVKNAVGMTLLAIPSFLPEGSPGRTYFNSEHGVWAIISFLYVLEPNTALTWRVGIMRLCGTFVGATFAFIMWTICRMNPYGIVIMITAAEILLTWLVRSSTPGVGVVASVTIPPIIFIPYLGLDYTTVINLAVIRGVQISIGIICAIMVNHFLFPRHCRVVFLSGMAQVLSSLTQLYLHLSHRTLHENARTRSGMLRGAKLDLKLREIIARQTVLLKQMQHEISLVPKPTELYRNATDTVQRIADLMSGLRRIRENVPQKQAIMQVLQHRQHTVSCICIVLFTCEHAFRSRRPLPQMIPSPRKAFEELSREIFEALHDAPRATDIAYVVAETEVLEEMIEALENLISVTRQLFGTNQWLFEQCSEYTSGSFGRSGVESPVVHTPRVSIRRIESVQ